MAPPRSGARRGRPSDAVIHYTKRLNRECAERGDVAGALRMSEQVKEYTFLVKDDRAKEGRRVANTEHVAIPDQKHGVSEPYR